MILPISHIILDAVNNIQLRDKIKENLQEYYTIINRLSDLKEKYSVNNQELTLEEEKEFEVSYTKALKLAKELELEENPSL